MAGDVLGCDVFINGEHFADGRETDDFTAPLALDGLRIVWGRDTTIDQPEPSTCEFEVMDAPGGAAFLSRIFTGATVEIRSTVEIDTGGGTQGFQTLPDPGFDTTAPGATPSNAQPELSSAVVVVDLGASQGHALDLTKLPGDASNPNLARVSLAPGPITSGDPDAWADLPRVPDASTWSYTLDVLAPLGAAVNVQGVYWYAPDGVGNGGAGSATVLNVVGTGEWESLEHVPFTITAPQPAWLGLWVQVSYTRWDQWPGTTNGATWDEVPDGLTWDDLATTHVDNTKLYLYGEAPTNDLVLFAGAVTDVEVAWDETLPPDGGARLKVTAADFTAQTNNFYIGAEPWAVEPMNTRFTRVVTMLNQQIPGGWGFGSVIDPTLGAIPLGYQDVDNQAAYGLLQSYAESVDGVLWPAVHLTYPRRYFYVEDINARASGVVLAMDDETGWVEVDDSGTAGRTRLSSCYVLRDPVTFRQSTEDVTTRVAVQWEEQTLNDDGEPAPTQRTLELVDSDAETRLGVRRVQTSTLLQTEADASNHAERKLRRLSSDAWRAGGVVWDLAIYGEQPGTPYPIDVQETAADLLDGTTRIGLPLVLTDLPEWSPSGGTLPVYVEGGTYEFTGGRWVLSLIVSNVYGAGSSAAWDDLPNTWRWDDFAPNADAQIPRWTGTPSASPSIVENGLGDTLRTNYAANSRGTSTGGRWARQNGAGEVTTLTYVTGAADGPVLPDGTRATSYVRCTTTTPKTGNTSGVFYRATPGDLVATAGTDLALAMYVRASHALTASRLSIQARSGTATTVTSGAGPVTALPAGAWVRLGSGLVTTGDADGFQVWCAVAATDVLPAGGTLDAVAVLVEAEAGTVPGPFFDGDSLPDPGTGGGVTWNDLYGAEVAPNQ